MKIDYIYLKNYRQYREARIDFAGSPNENFTVIEGPNGAGKTNLLNAVTWCLFGEEKHINLIKSKGLSIINTVAVDQAKEGELLNVKVEIQFLNNNNKRIKIIRELKYKKQKQTTIEIPMAHPPPSIIFEGEGDWSQPLNGEEATYQIKNLIPPSLEEYFFFDGERMNDYFRDNTGKDIQKAVFKISQLGLFDDLIRHLTARKNEFLRAAKDLDSKGKELQEFIELQEQSQSSDNEELKSLISAEHEAELLDEKLNAQLKNTSKEDIENLVNRREQLIKDLLSVKQEIKGVEDDKLQILHKKMATILCQRALLKTKTLIDNSRAAGKIPPKFEAIFIQSLLDKGKCICAADISGKDEYSNKRRKKIEVLLESAKLSKVSTELIETNGQIQEMFSGLTGFSEDIIDFEKRLKVLDALRVKTDNEIKVIGQQLETCDLENIRLLEQQKKKNLTKLKELTGDIAILRDHLTRREKLIKDKRSELEKEIKKDNKHKSLMVMFDLCEKSIKAAENIKETIMIEIKTEIEQKTSNQFLGLIWKKETFKGVTIDNEYNISVPLISGRDCFGTLSAGERQVCALAFMSALNSVSGFDVPVIIDTPLARISDDPRLNIAKKLPTYLQGTQVTLLVTKEEYTPDVQAALSTRVGKVYKINVQEEKLGNLAEVQIVK
ncbi:MAG: AAA family ATPase [Candidatus Bathyarchaeia archaeon]|jgi:DNA sulfur modification protein DndD